MIPTMKLYNKILKSVLGKHIIRIADFVMDNIIYRGNLKFAAPLAIPQLNLLTLDKVTLMKYQQLLMVAMQGNEDYPAPSAIDVPEGDYLESVYKDFEYSYREMKTSL